MKRTSELLREIAMNTSHPDGTYVSVKLSKKSQSDLDSWVSKNNIMNASDPSEYHSTVIYSRVGVPNAKSYDLNLPITASISGWKKFDTKLSESGKCLVAIVDSPDLNKHHNNLVNDYGATHDFEGYHPHITISYDYDGDIPEDVPSFNITYDDSDFKPLDPKFSPKKK